MYMVNVWMHGADCQSCCCAPHICVFLFFFSFSTEVYSSTRALELSIVILIQRLQIVDNFLSNISMENEVQHTWLDSAIFWWSLQISFRCKLQWSVVILFFLFVQLYRNSVFALVDVDTVIFQIGLKKFLLFQFIKLICVQITCDSA